METNGTFEFDSVCLGAYGLVATWKRYEKDIMPGHRRQPSLLIQSASAAGEGVFVPASDIIVGTVKGLIALRDAIDEALKYETPKKGECR